MQKVSEIRSLELFVACRPEQLRWIERHSDILDVPAGHQLAASGEPARQFIVVCSGVVASPDRLHGPGSHFGAADLITGRAQSETVVAETPVRVIVFEARAFRGLLDQAPSVARRLLREFVEDAYISAGQTA